MDLKQEILDIPRALSETLGKGRAEYEALVRRTRWGDGPLYVVSGGASFAGLTASYAFEGLLGWPVVTCAAEVFRAYSLAAVRPHSVVLVVSASQDGEEMLEVARAARSRGAQVLALTGNPTGALAQAADGVFLLRAGEETLWGVKPLACAQAALGYLSLTTARVLKRHHPEFDLLEEEFQKLSSSVQWALGQVPDAIRSLASEIQGSPQVVSAGAGFYHPVALEWARLVRSVASKKALGCDVGELDGGMLRTLDPNAAVVFLSGSKCRLRKQVRQAANVARKAGAKIIALTDSGDRELASYSTLAAFLPPLTEMVGSVVAFVLLAWVTCQVALATRERPERRSPRPA